MKTFEMQLQACIAAKGENPCILLECGEANQSIASVCGRVTYPFVGVHHLWKKLVLDVCTSKLHNELVIHCIFTTSTYLSSPTQRTSNVLQATAGPMCLRVQLMPRVSHCHLAFLACLDRVAPMGMLVEKVTANGWHKC